jgi:hypothetical protein
MSEEKYNDKLMPHQIDDIYDEEDAPIMDFRKRILKKFTYIGSVLFVLFILGSSLFTIPKHLNFQFTLKTKQQEFIGQYDHKLFIIEKNEITGSAVKKGTPVVTVTSQVIVEYLDELKRAKDEYQEFLNEKEELSETHLSILNLQLNSLQKKEKLLKLELEKLNKTYKADEKQMNFELKQQTKNYNRQKQLYKKQVIPEADFELAESSFEAIKNKLEVKMSQYERDIVALVNDLEACKSEIQIKHKEVLKFTQNQDLTENKLENKISAIDQKLRFTFGDYSVSGKGLIINAPFEGNLSYIFEGEKEVPEGAILFMVSNTSNNLYAQCAIPPEYIGMVHDSSRVVLKVASFPHYEYGVLRGTVQNLSQTPNIDGNYPFEANITEYGTLKPFLQKGMNGQLSIIVDEKSLFGYFFEKLNKKYSDLVDN